MTDMQLAILLSAMREELRADIESADKALGDSVERRQETIGWRHPGEEEVHHFLLGVWVPKDAERVTQDGDAIALEPLHELLQRWDDRIDDLREACHDR